MNKLTSAIMIACEAHEHQVDKAGQPYIFHPLRVMMSMDTEDERIVAVLHDVVEDYVAGWERVHDADFDEHILDAIDAVSRREGETYAAFIQRTKENELGRKVKLADINDNLLDWRSGSLSEKLRKRYEDARRELLEQP